LRVRGPRVVPGAVAGRLRMELDGVDLRDRISPGFEAESAVVEPAEGKGLRFRGLARGDAKAGIVDPCLDLNLILRQSGESDAAVTVGRQLAAHDAVSRDRMGDREKSIAAGIPIWGCQSCRAECPQVMSRLAEIEAGRKQAMFVDGGGFGSAIVQA